MSWLKRLWHAWQRRSLPEAIRRVSLTMPEWTEQDPSGEYRNWRNTHGDLLSLTAVPGDLSLADPSNERELQQASRKIAESRDGGLVETGVIACPTGTGFRFIYKRLEIPRYVYTGMLILPMQKHSLVWTHVAGECGTTGVREAVVTAELMNAGELTIQDYERCWAQDPYDPTYHGVDRSALRFISDDESYDNQFPHHPLTRVRALLWQLPHSFQLGAHESHGSAGWLRPDG